jgi:PhzF family phenazine biosynthesis protein
MDVLRYAAFTSDPSGGNPAGVVLDATGATAEQMQATAARLGYSESVFLLPRGGDEYDVRYFSPLAEVTFCGHATIAAGVAHGHRHGPATLRLTTRSGLVEVRVQVADEVMSATLISVPPRIEPLDWNDQQHILSALGWTGDELDPALPPRLAYAGAWHPVIAAATRRRLADLSYDFDALGGLMKRLDWTTVALVWRQDESTFHVRNPFPPGGVVEDPATGAAAAALGAYLRELSLVEPPARIVIHQGDDLGRPSLLTVDIPAGRHTGIEVSGTAVALD